MLTTAKEGLMPNTPVESRSTPIRDRITECLVARNRCDTDHAYRLIESLGISDDGLGAACDVWPETDWFATSDWVLTAYAYDHNFTDAALELMRSVILWDDVTDTDGPVLTCLAQQLQDVPPNVVQRALEIWNEGAPWLDNEDDTDSLFWDDHSGFVTALVCVPAACLDDQRQILFRQLWAAIPRSPWIILPQRETLADTFDRWCSSELGTPQDVVTIIGRLCALDAVGLRLARAWFSCGDIAYGGPHGVTDAIKSVADEYGHYGPEFAEYLCALAGSSYDGSFDELVETGRLLLAAEPDGSSED